LACTSLNISRLKLAEAEFLTRYPGGFADPGMATIKKSTMWTN
jgi:hypothetical protein